MKRKKLTVHRKAHNRKPYKKRTGKKVSGTRVKETTYKTKDVGKKGRTPKSEKWFETKGSLYGWKKDQPERTRHMILANGVRRDGYATIVRRLNALKNVSADKGTDKSAKADMAWMKNKYRG